MSPAETADHVGEDVVVEGHLDSAVCSPQACLLSFEPGFSGLIVAIPGDAVDRFPDPKGYEARRLRVRGTVGERGGRPRIEVRDPAAIEIVDGSAPPARQLPAAASPAAPPAEAARASGTADDGLPEPAPPRREPEIAAGLAAGAGAAAAGDRRVEVRVEGGTPSGRGLGAAEAAARLGLVGEAEVSAETELGPETELGAGSEMALLRRDLSALHATLMRVEERLGDLEARLGDVEDVIDRAVAEETAAAGQAAPGLPSYVIPGSTSPTMHRIGRGWSVERVVRVLGEPLQVTGRSPGPFTWYYGEGRALTVDERGRVLSAVGF